MIEVGCREAFLQFLKERFLANIFLIELKGTLMQMSEIEWYAMAYIPFKVVPIATFYGSSHNCVGFII